MAFYQNDYQMLDLLSKRRIAKFNYDKNYYYFIKLFFGNCSRY